MKTATKRADELKSLLRKAGKEHKITPPSAVEPLVALIKGILSFDASDEKAEEVWATFDKVFVDPNELRVATELELQDLIGSRYPAVEQRAAMLVSTLNGIFEREHTLNLDRLRDTKKTETRQFLHDLPGMTPFVEAYTLLIGFGGGGAVPIDQTVTDYLIAHDLFEANTSTEDVQKFVEHHTKADESFQVYSTLRAAAFHAKKK